MRASEGGRRLIVAVSLVAACAAGCEVKSHIYDGDALLEAGKLCVMPGVGAPGPDGKNAGIMQAGLLITELANLRRFEVTGTGHLRRELGDQADPWDPAVEARIARKLNIDLLVLPEVTDYRFTKEAHSQSFMGVSRTWTTSTYWSTVRLLIVHPGDGKLVYSGTGSAGSDKGYGPAVLQATGKSIQELCRFLAAAEKK